MKKLLKSALLIAALAFVPFAALGATDGKNVAKDSISEKTDFEASKRYDPGTGGGTGG